MSQYNRDNAGAAALAFARQLTGHPYIWGGTWPVSGGTDCSGLWEWAYAKVGVYLPRTTYGQYLVHQIPNSWPSEPGDLLFIAGSDAVGAAPGHVMGYVSPGQVFQGEYTGGPPIGQFPANTRVWEYRTRPALALPLPPKPPVKNPTPDDLMRAGLVALSSPAQARLALANGWVVYRWDGSWFVTATSPQPKGTTEYASIHYKERNARP